MVKTEADTLAWEEVYPCLDTVNEVEAEAWCVRRLTCFHNCRQGAHT